MVLVISSDFERFSVISLHSGYNRPINLLMQIFTIYNTERAGVFECMLLHRIPRLPDLTIY